MTLFHPAAEVFPMMHDAALQALSEDIKANGLQERIVRTKEGLIRTELDLLDIQGDVQEEPQENGYADA